MGSSNVSTKAIVISLLGSGMFYWTPETGAHEVTGATLAVWAVSGFEKEKWGYRTGNPAESSSGEPLQTFQHGQIDAAYEIGTAPVVLVDGKPINSLIKQVTDWLKAGHNFSSRSAVNGRDSRDPSFFNYGGVLGK